MLRSLGVNLVFDVGANIGQYGHLLRYHGYGGRIISFEPQAAPFQVLSEKIAHDPGWELVPFALGAQDEEAVLNVAAATGASSILPITDRHVAEDPSAVYVSSQKVRVRRLDDIAPPYLEAGANSRVAIKLDVQGYEAAVLVGAAELLRSAVFVECELQLAPYYEGQAPVNEVVNVLYNAGLHLAGTDHGHVDDKTGMVTWMDAIFVRERSSLTS